MICPRCKATLVKENREGVDVDVCRSCNGMWVHKNQLNILLKESGGDVEMCSIDDNPHDDKFPVIKCRECEDETMKKINFLDYSDIIMDYCSSCGSMWLDKDELANMHKYIKKVEEGSHESKNPKGFERLLKLNEIAYSIFH